MSKETEILDNLARTATESVERASKQTEPVPRTFMASTMNWVKKLEMDEPEWGRVRGGFTDNRIRDEWLQMITRAEPHLNGVLNTAITLDANRQYRMIGGRNQIIRFTERFNGFDNGLGFKTMQTLNATNYYTSDIGAIVEKGVGKGGQLESLYHTDPTRFRLGEAGILKYDGKDGIDEWSNNSYYRLVSQRSTQDKLNGLGFCALSRCVKLAQTMVAVVEHNLEKLQQIAPKGFLFIQAEDLTQESWQEAVDARSVSRGSQTGNQYYDDIMVLVDRAAKGDLLALSQLPDKFDAFEFTDYMMKGYALAFGRPVRAFWSLNSGNFGGGTETKVQAEQATYGGAAEFILSSQEQIQWLLPDSVLFEYEVEDTNGKLVRAELDKVLIEASKGLIEIGLTMEMSQDWLAQRGVIPSEWTNTQIEVADNGVIREKLLETEQIQRALDLNPDEPIVMYTSSDLVNSSARIVRLWDNKDDAVGKSWRVTREIDVENMEDFDGSRGDYMFASAAESMLAENDDRDDTQEEAYLLALALLNGSEPPDDDTMGELARLMDIIVPTVVFIALINLWRYSNSASDEAQLTNIAVWENRDRYFRNIGKILGNPDQEFRWDLGDAEHCGTCLGEEGKVKTGEEWMNSAYIPGSGSLECGGYNCKCELVPTG